MNSATETIVHADLAENCGFRIEYCDACLIGIDDERDAFLWNSQRWPRLSNGTTRTLVLCHDCVEILRRRGLRGLQRRLSKQAAPLRAKLRGIEGFAQALSTLTCADVRIVEPISSPEVPF